MLFAVSGSLDSQEVNHFFMCHVAIVTIVCTEINSLGGCCQTEKILHCNLSATFGKSSYLPVRYTQWTLNLHVPKDESKSGDFK